MDRLTVTASKSWTEVRRFQTRMRRRALEERRRRANCGGLEERYSGFLGDRMEAGVPDIAELSTMQGDLIEESQLPALEHASNIAEMDSHESLAQLGSTNPPVPAAFLSVQTTSSPNGLLGQARACNLDRSTAIQQLPGPAEYPHGASTSAEPTLFSSESVPSSSGQCGDPLQDRCLLSSYAMLHECSYRALKKPNWCSNCGAKKFAYESSGFCCYNGKVILPVQDPPEELHYLFTDAGVMASEFRKNIRGYNTAFAFTSLCVKVDSTINDGCGPYAFRIQGQIYQKIHHLMSPDETPRFLQLYIHDTQNEIPNRMAHFPNLSAVLMSNIKEVLDRTNPLVKVLRTSREISELHQYNLIINKNVARNAGVYNMPETSQVAAVWVEGNNLDGIQERCIVLQPRSGPCCSINGTSGCYDPLQYPLLFPFGEGGWQTDLVSTNQSRGRTSCKITAREYYSYKLQIRRGDKSVLLRVKRLLQQYVVDMYVKIETSRLLYLRGIQPRLRKELRRGLHDSILQGIVESSNVGMPVILPASFIGGPRDMQKRYRDAMAIVHHLGKPDLFLTITCNSSWPEIQAELYDGQRPEDRPDLCTRIFYNKLRDLMHLLVKERYFGVVLGYVVVVEFQKRGLPHAHMLLILDKDSKPRTPEDYDALVSAEIPALPTHQQLHTRVARHMIHGPCGHLRPSSPCMRNGRCRFHYPRMFVDHTVHGTDGYPIYRRRNMGFSVEARGCMLDSRWVVPYNPALLLMFDCHINVEICSSVAAVKYLYKYVYKGHDRVQFTVAAEENLTQVDEIRRFQEARWIFAPEAIWRIFGFDLYNMMPAVYNLVVHLPEEQTLYFLEGSDLQTVVNAERNEKTMLTEFFRLNCISPPNQPLLYREMPLHYVWNKSGSFWSKRKKDYVIGRMYAVSPAEGDKYYLRLLLNHVPGPVSFDYLKTANGVTFPSFKESCVERGLLEDDRAAYLCMEEAILYQMPSALRELFSTLLLFCDPLSIRELWETFWPFMAEDFKKDNSSSNEQLKDLVLADVDKRLRNGHRKIKDFDLPIPSGCDDRNQDSRYASSSDGPGNHDSCAGCVLDLNGCQSLAYHTILGAIERGEPGVYFVDGPAGTGKTFLYRALLYTVRTSMRGLAIATASSGIASVNMPGGQTAHSRFKIPLKLSRTSTCNISKQSADAELFRKAMLFIWDEAPMTHKYAFEALDRTMRDIMSKNQLFGGKIFVFGGDFRQVLPVIPRGCRAEIVDACLIKSYLWPSMQILPLKENMRSLSDPLFSKFVLGVGDGAEPTLTEDFISIPPALLVNGDRNSLSCVPLVDRIFPQIENLCADEAWVAERAILATRNDYVNEINEVVLSRFPGNEVVYHSYDSVDDDRLNLYPEEFLNTLAPGGFPLHKLRLKQGTPIMLLRNLNPTEGLCNGAQLICTSFGRNLIEACVANGQFAGRTVFLPRIPMMPSEDANIAFSFKRKQFPIKLAFAMTINKSQGQTIKNVGIYLPEPVFGHGQLYVALSRGVNSAGTSILLAHNQPSLGVNGFTRNVVYREPACRMENSSSDREVDMENSPEHCSFNNVGSSVNESGQDAKAECCQASQTAENVEEGDQGCVSTDVQLVTDIKGKAPVNEGHVNRVEMNMLYMHVVAPIRFIHPYSKLWNVIVTPLEITGVIQYDYRRGSGKIFRMVVADNEGERIAAIAFGVAAEKCNNCLKIGYVYCLRSCSVGFFESAYTPSESGFEITIKSNTVIEYISNLCDGFLPVRYRYLRLNDIGRNIGTGVLLDVIGLVVKVGGLIHCTNYKTGNASQRRTVRITDRMGSSSSLVLWDETADAIWMDDFEKSQDINVIVVTAVKTLKHGGGSLSTTGHSKVIVNPENEESMKLRAWALESGFVENINSREEGAGLMNVLSAVMDQGARKVTIETVYAQPHWLGPRFQIYGILSITNGGMPWYIACPACTKKLPIDNIDASLCVHCGKSCTATCMRYLLQGNITDWTGSVTVTIFDHVAQTMLGASADSLYLATTDGKASVKKELEKITTKRMLFQLSADKLNINSSEIRNFVVLCVDTEMSGSNLDDAFVEEEVGKTTEQKDENPVCQIHDDQHVS